MSARHNLTLRYVANPDDVVPADTYWLRIHQEILDDRATAADVAEVVDALYDLNPCVDVEVEGIDAEPTEATAEKLAMVAATALDLAECRRLLSGTYQTKVKIIRSHPDLPSTLRLSVGEILQTVVVTEAVTLTLDVESASTLLLEYPVVSGLVASWLGPVYNARGSVQPPAIKAARNTLYWSGAHTGTIRAEFSTRYDQVTIEVPGIPKWEGAIEGDSQDTDLLVFYHYQVYQKTLSPPPVDTTLTPEDLDNLCHPGSGSHYEIEDDDKPLPEPPPPPEYGCIDPDRLLADPAFYQKTCCTPPPFPLPDCAETKSPKPGGGGLSEELMATYRDGHNGPVEFIAVGPSGVEGCGSIFTTQKVRARRCCDDVVPMTSDPQNPDSISPGGRERLCIIGGGQERIWTASGGLFFDNGYQQVMTDDNCMYVNAGSPLCAHPVVQVDDGCSRLSMPMLNLGHVPLSVSYISEEIPVAGSVTMIIEGGAPPIILRTSGAHTKWAANGLAEIVLAGGGQLRLDVDPQQLCDGDFLVIASDACADVASKLVLVQDLDVGARCVQYTVLSTGLSDWCDGPHRMPESIWIQYDGVAYSSTVYSTVECELPVGTYYVLVGSRVNQAARMVIHERVGGSWPIDYHFLANATSVPDVCDACN